MFMNLVILYEIILKANFPWNITKNRTGSLFNGSHFAAHGSVVERQSWMMIQ